MMTVDLCSRLILLTNKEKKKKEKILVLEIIYLFFVEMIATTAKK